MSASSADARRIAEARVGTVLRDKWRIERVLGMGGFGAVYAATHRTGKRVAIKLLHPELEPKAIHEALSQPRPRPRPPVQQGVACRSGARGRVLPRGGAHGGAPRP